MKAADLHGFKNKGKVNKRIFIFFHSTPINEFSFVERKGARLIHVLYHCRYIGNQRKKKSVLFCSF